MTRLLAGMSVVLAAGSLWACQVPVFRYALERWDPDPYRIVLLHEDRPDAALAELISGMSGPAGGTLPPANLALETHDVHQLSDTARWRLPHLDESAPFPRLQVYFPESLEREEPIWDGPASREHAEYILHSPARTEIRDRLVTGDSVVWVLVEGTDPDANDRAEAHLSELLRKAASQLEIPDGVIGPEELGRRGPDEPPIDMEDVLRSSIPLHIAFSVLRLQRSQPEEWFLLRMLLSGTPYLEEQPEIPVAIPVFGRGRMVPGLPATHFSESAIFQASSYLCGACSCLVKSENPGFDLLMRADWDELTRGSLVLIEKALPPLTGAGDLMEPMDTPPAMAETPSPTPQPGSTTTWSQWMGWALGLAVAGIGLASLVLWRRNP